METLRGLRIWLLLGVAETEFLGSDAVEKVDKSDWYLIAN